MKNFSTPEQEVSQELRHNKTPEQQRTETSWIDTLPQIDLSCMYATDTIFSREEIYCVDNTKAMILKGVTE
jgi:hypothetical protein